MCVSPDAVKGDGEYDGLLYSADCEGLIRVWKVPEKSDIEPYGKDKDASYCVGLWNGHNQPVWELQHHPGENCLLSLGSDHKVLLWKTLTEEQSL
jgi:WD40 repeat protein